MKKTIILLLLSCGTIALHAQDLELQSIDCNAEAKNFVAKIKKYSPDNLLPYYDKASKKWGFMTKYGKILTEPLTHNPSDFNINIHNRFYLYNHNGCDISIDLNDYTYRIDNVNSIVDGQRNNALLKGFTIRTVANTNEVNQDAEIATYSNIYHKIDKPVMYNGKWYAVVTSGNWKRGIIDQDGNTLPNFDFQYNSLFLLTDYKGENNNQHWFYFEDAAKNKGFINLEGETKLKNELLSSCSIKDYPYSLQSGGGKSGVFDLRTLTWTIEPQTEFKNFERVLKIGQSYDAITYYIVVSDGEEKYLIDINKNIYKPKK